MRAKINIDTLNKIYAFVRICEGFDCRVDLIDGSGYRVSAKSTLGAVATMDWSQVFVECEKDIRRYIEDFIED